MAIERQNRDLPGQITSLVGREADVAELSTLLRRSDVRLVTLTGAGGIGKTRLAVATAELIARDFRDGAVFIPLAAIRDPELVVPTIAQEFGVRERAGVPAREGLVEALAGRNVLIILDNFEQIRQAAIDISWLLSSCAGVKLLVTSRGRLHLRGEHEITVPPLPLPPAAGGDVAAGVDDNAAIQLFVQRAQEVQPDLELTPATRPVIAEICRRLDGIPLAIELAAARVKVLPPAALLARLDRRLPLLTGGPRDLPGRLQTMRNAIAWSYDLLQPEDQELFRDLCVFTGGFTLLEAEAIVTGVPSWSQDGAIGHLSLAASPVATDVLLDGLTSLVDNGLLQQDELEGEPRFRLLETLREFGLEQLERTGDLPALRDRHADFFIEFAEAALPRLRGTERSSWLERLERAHDNLRAALTWLSERGDTRRAIRLAGALWQFWWWRSHLSEGRQRLESVLAMPNAAENGAWWARALTGCGALAETQGDYERSEAYHERAVAAWEALDDKRGLATSLLFRWLVAFNAEDQARMTALSTESMRLFTEVSDTWGTAMSYMQQGVQAMRARDPVTANRALDEGIARFREVGDAWGVAICQGVAGNVATDMGDFATAARVLKESLTALLLLDDLWGVATIMPAASRMSAELGDYEQAVRISGAILRLHRTMGAPLKVPFRERYERNLALAKKELGSERFARLLAEGEAMTPAEAVRAAIEPVKSAPAVPAGVDALAIPLSPREREVIRLVPGRTAKEIGQALFISESTVRTHIENIFNKLGVRNQKELIAYIYEHQLI